MKLFQVDAFTDVPFKGNPAAVCLLEDERPATWMQSVAAEMNLSETAFLQKQSDSSFHLRWFTPAAEVSLCGHATLASAHILWEGGILSSDEQAVFHTKSGVLTAVMRLQWIEMAFPSRTVEKADVDPAIPEAIGISPIYAGQHTGENGDLYLLEVSSDHDVLELEPDFQALLTTDARAVIVTSASSKPEFDFVSRFFAPAVGINEDPVTGSAHCYLAPYWTDKLSKIDLVGFQASRRSGVVRCRVTGEGVQLKGKATTIFRGELLI